MGRMINDIPFSDMSHNSRVLKLHNRMKDAQTRFSEAQKSKITIKGEVIKSTYSNDFFKGMKVKKDSIIEPIIAKPLIQTEELQEEAIEVDFNPLDEAVNVVIPEPTIPKAIPALGKLKVKKEQVKKESAEQIKLFNKYLLSFLELPPFYNRQVVVSFPSPSILKIEKMLNYQNPVKIGLSINSLHNEELIKSFDTFFEYLSKFRHIKKEHIRIMYVKDSSRLRLYLYVWSTINHHYEYVKELELYTEKYYNNLKMVV
jgi:hypothetical protein